jgi:acetyl esterase/lipase
MLGVSEVVMGIGRLTGSKVIVGLASIGVLTACAANPATGREPMAWSAGQIYSVLTSELGINAENGVAYGPHPRQKLDIYRADPTTEKSPIVVFYYGGSWKDGDRAVYKFVGTALAKRGITTVIPDYRLFPEVQFPGFVDDAAKAYGWVGNNAARFGRCSGDRPIIVVGHSAGAHMAALLSLDASYLDRHAKGTRRPAAMIGLAGPYAFDPTTWPSTKDVFASARGHPDRTRPVTFAGQGKAPPTLLLHGSDDETVKLYNTRDLGAAIKSAGQKVRVIEYPGIGHVGLILTVSKPLRWRASTLDDMVGFIEQHGAKACVPPGTDGKMQ